MEEILDDYTLIDNYIQNSLKDFNKKLFGDYNTDTGFFEEIPESDDDSLMSDEQDEDIQAEGSSSDYTEDELYDMVFDDDFEQPSYSRVSNKRNTSPVSNMLTFKKGVNSNELSPSATYILDELSKLVGNVVVTSGKRSSKENTNAGGVKNSFHLSGRAVDLRPNETLNKFLSSVEGRKFMNERGYEIVDERSKKGSAHWHLEPAKKRTGGMSVAVTPGQQYIGLNDESIDELMLPLQGTNIIRGLDSAEPVYVVDEEGKTVVLRGKNDTSLMTGKVFEKRLKAQTGTSNIKPFYVDAADKKRYQESLTNLYRSGALGNEKSVIPFLSKDRTKITGVELDNGTCIDGVCGIMERAGKMWNSGTVNGHYIGNETFYDNAYLYNKEDVYNAVGNFQVGDVIQATTPLYNDKGILVRKKPWDAKVIVDIGNDNTGNKIFYTRGGSGGSTFGGSTYSESELKDLINKNERVVTRPGYQLDKDALKKERENLSKNEIEVQNILNERKLRNDIEVNRDTPYIWSLRKDGFDVNSKTKSMMTKFIDFANNDTNLNKLVKYTGASKADINDSLLNVFGTLGQENKWQDRTFGGTLGVENLYEKIFKPKNKSIGPGQIKFNAIPKSLKEAFDINNPSDLYNIDKVLPLMVAMDIDNKNTLKRWGNKGVLAQKLFGYEDADLQYENLENAGRYSPYLRNQYSSIANRKAGNNTKYKLDVGSYPYKVMEKWSNNIERVVKTDEDGYPLILDPEVVISTKFK